MPAENKVWLVSYGDYSDYRIVGVFSSLEQAQAAAALIGGRVDNDNGVEVDALTPYVREGLRPYSVTIRLRDGEVTHYRELSPEWGENWIVETTSEVGWGLDYDNKTYYRGLTLKLMAKDIDHVCKIAAEKRRALLTDPAYVPISVPTSYRLGYPLQDGE